MSGDWFRFLCGTWIAIGLQGVFALFEMACISFNKVRLQYYVSLGKRRAMWINFLLNRPSRLFGTTLIAINTALQFGSECARRFYESMHFDPDWSPLTQVILVVIFSELAPLFAARRHPEQAAMFLVPVMVPLARLLSPITWTFDALSHLIHRLMRRPVNAPLYLSREEVKMAFEDKKRRREDEFNQVAARIFQLKNRTVAQFMIPLTSIQVASTSATKADIKHLLSIQFAPFIPLYHRFPHNIVGVIQLRDLLRLEETQKAIDSAHPPWFVAKGASILEILDQFRCNNQSVAIVLDTSGQSCGLLSLDEILTQIFGPEASHPLSRETLYLHIERTLSGDMEIATFNRDFQSHLPHTEGETLSDLIVKHLDHLPVIGETVRVGSYSFTVLEPSLKGVKLLTASTISSE